MFDNIRIRPSEQSEEILIEVYQGSNVGWTMVKSFRTRNDAEQYLIDELKKRFNKGFGNGSAAIKSRHCN